MENFIVSLMGREYIDAQNDSTGALWAVRRRHLGESLNTQTLATPANIHPYLPDTRRSLPGRPLILLACSTLSTVNFINVTRRVSHPAVQAGLGTVLVKGVIQVEVLVGKPSLSKILYANV
jgi:hypothetical protein